MGNFFSVSVYLVFLLYLNRNLFSFGNFSSMIFVKKYFLCLWPGFLIFLLHLWFGFFFYTTPEFLIVLCFGLLMLTLIFSLAVWSKFSTFYLRPNSLFFIWPTLSVGLSYELFFNFLSFLFQMLSCFGYRIFLYFHINFEIVFSVSVLEFWCEKYWLSRLL